MFYRADFGGFLVCCYKAIRQLNGVETNSFAISLMLNHNVTGLLFIYLFIHSLIHRSIHIWVCKLILYLSLNRAKTRSLCIWTCIFTGFRIVAGTGA